MLTIFIIFHLIFSGEAARAFGISECKNCPLVAEPKHGPEWTFTSAEILTMDPAAKRAVMKRVIRTSQAKWLMTKNLYWDFGYETDEAEHRISLSAPGAPNLDMWLTSDPKVIEVKATPLTTVQWKRYKTLVDIVLFDAFKTNHIYPDAYYGGGQISTSVDSFTSNLAGLAMQVNFVTEFLNRPEVYAGVIFPHWAHVAPSTFDLSEYPGSSLALLHERSRKRLESHDVFLREFRPAYANFIKKLKAAVALNDEDAFKTLYSEFFVLIRKKRSDIPIPIQFNLNHQNVWFTPQANMRNGTERLENRSLPAQRNMDHFLAGLELTETVLTRAGRLALRGQVLDFQPNKLIQPSAKLFWEGLRRRMTRQELPLFLASYGEFTQGMSERAALQMMRDPLNKLSRLELAPFFRARADHCQEGFLDLVAAGLFGSKMVGLEMK